MNQSVPQMKSKLECDAGNQDIFGLDLCNARYPSKELHSDQARADNNDDHTNILHEAAVDRKVPHEAIHSINFDSK